MNRREFLTLTAATAASGAALSFLGPVAFAGNVAQVTAAQRFKVGDVTVTSLSDGFISMTPELFAGLSADEFQAALKAAFLKPGAYTGSVNAFIIDTGSKVHIVDSGSGNAMGPLLGKLESNLTAAGYKPDAVATLLLTHLHPDHVGGSLKDGKPLFTSAEFVVSDADRAFWSDAGIRSQAPDAFKPFYDLAVASLKAHGDRMRIATDGGEAASGVTAVALPGHTPGHVGYRVSSGSDSLLIWGDIVHVAPIQLAKPEVSIAFDVDQALAAKTRKAILEQVAMDRVMVAGAHLPFPGIGHIEASKEGGYRFVAATWDYL
jgi:glyoxylase-like metal-dependent hydrolase (beta-lactamase superfamily II)